MDYLFASDGISVEISARDGHLDRIGLSLNQSRLSGWQGSRPESNISRFVESYFMDKRWEPALVNIDWGIFTPFTARLFQALMGVDAGSVVTYGQLANRAGAGKAGRAAGQALSRNPFPLLIPCHRVVASNGLGGFSTRNPVEGLLIKKRLLSWECSPLFTNR